MKARNTGAMLSVAVGVMLAAASSQAADRFGEAIPADAKKATLAELIAKPDAYHGKDVVVDGNFGGKCCGADFFFKDNLETIEVTPPANGKQCMLLKAGTPIRLYGKVNVIKREAAEGQKAPEPIVSIEGKGVEVRQIPSKK